MHIFSWRENINSVGEGEASFAVLPYGCNAKKYANNLSEFAFNPLISDKIGVLRNVVYFKF